jgi:SAM-dependent methyltransferase
MKVRRSRYLDDGLGFNRGQEATVIDVEHDDDFDALMDYILKSDFYGQAYLPRQSGHVDDCITAHFWWVAEMVARLAPRLVLDIGCGRGDVLRILQEERGVDTAGIDFGSALLSLLWPSLHGSFHAGEILDVLRDWDGPAYDVACGFDIWEHLRPRTLDETIAQLVAHSTDDALFLFVIPAFGDDAVFGEQFPLELEENRRAFDERVPFRCLLADGSDEHVPAAGHLTWAHTDWWVRQFTAHGLVREPALEREIHRVVDPHIPHSIKSFYVFRRPTAAAQARVQALSAAKVPALTALGAIVRRRRYERRVGARFTETAGQQMDTWIKAHAGPLTPIARGAAAAAARVSHRGVNASAVADPPRS